MTADSNILTVKDYLSGKVRDIDIPDPTLASILLDAGCDTVTYEKKVEDEDAPSEATDDSDEQSEESGETPKETHTEIVTEKITGETDVTLLTEKQRELSLAWLYVWVAGSPTQVGAKSEEDADWRHSDGGYRMSANVLSAYLRMANAIFDKYDLPTVGESNWSIVGRGICNPRFYNRRRR